ncbi:tetratricopeptide repeat protein [Xanthobacter dioxanivorans]|uniref:Tetratricopeptide repeat protein n=1 Tax=Xanthobacter dioxanivorans TaxID=2528964 RepID=A0A974SHM6_9HYPH|nr:tetratricopeptide repeat-containing sulfotransferase family protein [Xanthobacter dioxanivorans]QRG05497.1 tetratricopeptide repeat protein [Xanthobacter dioxanivorans]
MSPARPGPVLGSAQALVQAWDLYRAGQWPAAEALARAVLEKTGASAEAAHLVSVILAQSARLAEAAAFMEQAVALDPGRSSYHSNLCEMRRQLGDLAGAISAGRAAVACDPAYAPGANNLGIALFESGDLDEAIALYRKAIALKPAFAEAHNNLGNALRAGKQPGEAIAAFKTAIACRPHYAEAHNNLGNMLREQQNFREADLAFQQAIALKRDYVEPYTSLALSLFDQQRSEEAFAVLALAISAAPDRPEPAFYLAQGLLQERKAEGARSACQRALRANPDHVPTLTILARILRELERVEDAIAIARRALDIDPDHLDALNILGLLLMESGDLRGARAQFEQALRLDPGSLNSLINLVSARKVTRDDPCIGALEDAVAGEAGEEARIPLHFALGKAYDDAGRHADALAQFMSGARLKRALLTYDEAATHAIFDRVRTIFTRAFLAERSGRGDPQARPIFIVGMPRSGSTLVEQILASHARIQGGGEMDHLHRAVGRIDQDFGGMVHYPELMHLMEPDQMRDIIATYGASMPRLAPGRRVVIDKMLNNFFYVGLIHILFPHATIIHCRRDPVDTCISCFSKLFRDDIHYSYDFGELARYYGKYAQLMEHWQHVLPAGAILDVQYEEVVRDIESAARRLIQRCGEEWDPACLRFHETDRPIRTASITQVREPLYATSVGRWRRYGPALQPLVDALGPGSASAR